jgi:hypothetical protein
MNWCAGSINAMEQIELASWKKAKAYTP